MDGTMYASAALAPRTAGAERGRRDALSLILGAAERWDLFSAAIAVAVSMHVGMLVFAFFLGLLADVKSALDDDRAKLHEFFWRQYDVEVEKPKEVKPQPPPPEPPPPEPAPMPKAQPKVVEDDPYKNLPPTPAKAAKVLTAEPKNDEPVELPTIVSGEGTAVGGMRSGEGKGKQITMQRAASNQGVPGGRGTAAAAQPPAPVEDKSRPIGLTGGSAWNCPFPPEADADQIDNAVVGVQVTVGPDGSATTVAVVSDPGHGFGRAAKACAKARRYQPALDKSGTAIVSSTMVNVRFYR
jgi:protein TonB